MAKKQIDLGLTGLDELFMDDKERVESQLPKIYEIPLSEIDEFPNHPFHVRLDEDMDQLVESIKERGIITPVTLRQKPDGRYEIVSGHRRTKACELAGLTTVKAEIKELSRDEAIILMVESNLQRTTILPSEKAFSYKMRLEAMKRQGERSDLTSVPVAQKSKTSREELGAAVGESQDQVRRYIRLTHLIEPLLDLVDSGKIAFRPAVELSYLTEEEQNSLYTMQKYLQYHTLKEKGLLHFDAWASTFGETVTAIELAPEGTGYRSKTRFAKFFNLPELMSMFKEIADIQTADMLKLPVPEAEYHNVVLQPSEQQKKIVASLSERAEKVRNKQVDSNEDNMLVITNDGRKLALDQRLINPMLPDSDTGKVAVCAENVYNIWERTAEKKSTQMVFVDLSTPHNDGQFNVYDDLKKKLLDKGIPESEIAYIHDAKTEAAKKELFGKVRSGEVRVLIGSTQKMGAGTNAQRKLIALHHMDCPWRPSDLQQREGRIIRQGNENPKVDMVLLKENTRPNEDGFSPMVIDSHTFTEKKAAGTALLDACNTMTGTNPIPLGSYRGFQMTLYFDSFEKLFKISLQGALTYKVGLGTDVFGNIQRIDNLLESMPTRQIEYKEKLKNLEIQVENAKQEVAKPFPREDELKEKSARLDQLNILLNMDKRENEIVDGIQDEGEIQPQRESRDWER